jgi:hypothetical protein
LEARIQTAVRKDQGLRAILQDLRQIKGCEMEANMAVEYQRR